MAFVLRYFVVWVALVLIFSQAAHAAVVTATWNSALDVPVSASSYTATGNTVNFTLGHAPATGATLTVVNNTGLPFISGTFDNLTQGQEVTLTYGGQGFNFLANYYGGTGNDLVLVWAGARPLAWGLNTYGHLGNNATNSSLIPTGVRMDGTPLEGRKLLAVSTGDQHTVAVCSDGTLTSWGRNNNGQLGNNTVTNSSVPVAVTTAGTPLAGKTVVAVSAGMMFSVALCSDGTLATWGFNSFNELGNGNTTNSLVPGGVIRTGTVLEGRTVVGIGAGMYHCVVLCSDGTFASWGDNLLGQLGNGTTTAAPAPVPVTVAGTPLAGKTVVAMAVGTYHTLVLCSDGSLLAWGGNTFGQLGNGNTTHSSVPVNVTVAGTPLAGKTIVALGAGSGHSLALCSDGTLAAWGSNMYGRLGNGSTTHSSVPVAVTTSGVLAGKTVVELLGGSSHSMVRCSDGTVATWGFGNYGQLGNNDNSSSSTAVAVSSSMLASGERFRQVFLGQKSDHNLALVAVPAPTITTQTATAVTGRSAVLNGQVNPNGSSSSSVSFEYGTDTTYGTTVAALPASVTGSSATTVSASLSGLTANTTYHYRVRATAGIANSHVGAASSFTTMNGNLSALALGAGTLSPAFSPVVYHYSAAVATEVTSITVTPALSDSNASLTVNGTALASGGTSNAIPLAYGDNTIRIVVTTADLTSTVTHTVVVRRAAPALVTASYTSAATVPLVSHGLTATGSSVEFSLGYAPWVGTTLTVVNNTGVGFIQGEFSNLAQGQVVNLAYNGGTYPFVANYYGGTGNDLVLVWAGTRVVAWGASTYGALGSSSTGSMAAVTTVGTPLAGRTLLKLASGGGHSLALCSDGTLVAWGRNDHGQLGNAANTNSSTPVAVTVAGTALAGKYVIAISAGDTHSLALCSDGTLAAWGGNNYGQLGNNTTTSSNVPVTVMTAGTPLAGRAVVALGAGASHNLVLCSDGTLVTWGAGPLGTGGSSSGLPVAVTTAGTPLAGRTAASIAVGVSHNVVACSDGTLVSWGINNFGQLGNNTVTDSLLPTAVATVGTVVAGKTIASLATGAYHNLVLCSDGTLAAWGFNSAGALGNGSIVVGRVPGPVTTTGVLSGRTLVAVTAGGYFSQVRCADGSVAAWGANSGYQLGNGSTSSSFVPVLVSTSALQSGERLTALHPGSSSGHSLGIVSMTVTPTATTLPASRIASTTAQLNGAVNASGSNTVPSFEYGLDTSYGQTVAATQINIAGSETTAVSAPLTGLLPNTTYHFRVIGTNGSGTSRGADQTFTTLNGVLSTLTPGLGTLSPSFSPTVYNYHATVGLTDSSVAFTPVAADSLSTITVNGAAVASGSATSALPLAHGDNVFRVVVTAAGSTSTVTYMVVVTRPLPAAWAVAYGSGSEVPATTTGVTDAGGTVDISLNYAPQPGTTLTVMNNVGRGLINGRFSNLAHGQRVTLRHNGVDYPFMANYYGGTGNDLVLVWAYARPVGWGWNAHGQLGNGTTVDSTEFVPITTAGTSLAGRSVLALAAAGYHSLALCSDGSLHTWGAGAAGYQSAYVPAPVITTGTVLEGKTVVAITTRNWDSYALCSDGTISRWERVGSQPSAVPTAGTALAGKTVVAIATSMYSYHLALCSDGSLVKWGDSPTVPVVVPVAGTPLEGRSVVSIAAGGFHHLALCSDGTLVGWGVNDHGQLGANIGYSTLVPVPVQTEGTALEGKTVTAVTAGYQYSAALCSDGTIAAWGRNADNGLGVTPPPTDAKSTLPAVVNRVGALAGKTVVDLKGAGSGVLARCSDDSVVSWGLPGVLPAEVSSSSLSAGERVTSVFASSGESNVLGLASSPPPAVTTLAAAPVGTTTAVLQGTVNANGTPFPATVFFDYGLDTSYGRTAAATPASASGSSPVAVSAALRGLQSNTTYHYRVRVAGGSAD
ncbi:MAG: cadherin-like beta sandwich domain-containing protein, partial [Prosthecobacter sp.]